MGNHLRVKGKVVRVEGTSGLTPVTNEEWTQGFSLYTPTWKPVWVLPEIDTGRLQQEDEGACNALVLQGDKYKVLQCDRGELIPTDEFLLTKDAERVPVHHLLRQTQRSWPHAHEQGTSGRAKAGPQRTGHDGDYFKFRLGQLNPILTQSATIKVLKDGSQALNAVLAIVLCHKQYYARNPDILNKVQFVEREKAILERELDQNSQGSFEDAFASLRTLAESEQQMKLVVQACTDRPDLLSAARERWPKQTVSRKRTQIDDVAREGAQYVQLPQVTDVGKSFRQPTLNDIIAHFSRQECSRTIRFLEISGEGGVGKSTLAQMYAKGDSNSYDMTVMVTLSDTEPSRRQEGVRKKSKTPGGALLAHSLEESKRKILTALELGQLNHSGVDMQFALNKLRSNTSSLIILDNASSQNDLISLVNFDVDTLQKNSCTIDVIVTTRRKLVANFLRCFPALKKAVELFEVEVPRLDMEEAGAFIKDLCPQLECDIKSPSDRDCFQDLLGSCTGTFVHLYALSKWIDRLYSENYGLMQGAESCLFNRLNAFLSLSTGKKCYERKKLTAHLQHQLFLENPAAQHPLLLSLHSLEVCNLVHNARALYTRFAILSTGNLFSHVLLRLLWPEATPEVWYHFQTTSMLRKIDDCKGLPIYCDLDPCIFFTLHDVHLEFAKKLAIENGRGVVEPLSSLEEEFFDNFLHLTENDETLLLDAAKDPYLHEHLLREYNTNSELGISVLLRFLGNLDVVHTYYGTPSGRFKITAILSILSRKSEHEHTSLLNRWRSAARTARDLKLVGDMFKALGDSVTAKLYFERAEDLYKDSPLERARCLRELCWACTVQATQSFASELYVNPQELLGNAWEYALKAVNLLKECDDRGLDYAIACNVLAETGLKCADNDVEVNLLYEYMYPDGTVIEDNFLLVPSSDSPDSLFTFLNDKLLSTTYSEALRDTAVFCRTDKNLASISLRRGDTEEALKLLHEVMEKEKKEAPPDFALAHHATTLEKLGDIYLKNRQRGDPVFYFQSALDIRLKVFGADHHDIVRVRRKLSELAQAG